MAACIASGTEVLALIPARCGSKAVRDKNVRPLAGKPLLAWSIGHALAAMSVTRTIVSTDSERYAEMARAYGAETPFLRPEHLSQDTSCDLDVFTHALTWLDTHEGYRPALCVHLRPTYPIRDPADIDRMVDILVEHEEIDAVRSVVASPETPFKMWFRDPAGRLTPVIETSIHDACSQPRQTLPMTYLQNASIDVVRPRVLLGQRSMTGQHVFGYLMQDTFDIDDEAQLERAARYLE